MSAEGLGSGVLLICSCCFLLSSSKAFWKLPSVASRLFVLSQLLASSIPIGGMFFAGAASCWVATLGFSDFKIPIASITLSPIMGSITPPAADPIIGAPILDPSIPPPLEPRPANKAFTPARASFLFDSGLSTASPRDCPLSISDLTSNALPMAGTAAYPAIILLFITALPNLESASFPSPFFVAPPMFLISAPIPLAALLAGPSATSLAALTSAVTASFVALAAGLEATDFNFPPLALGAVVSADSALGTL